MSNLVLSSGSALDDARRWSQLAADELKRRAAAAARDRDAVALWELTRAHLLMHGSAGVLASRHTLRNYASAVRCLVAAWAGESLLHPSRDAGYRYVRDLEADRLKPATITVKLAGARCLYAALRWSGATEVDPFHDVTPARDPRPRHERRQPYPDADVDRLLAIASPSDRVVVLLGAQAGLRAAEIVSLRWQHVDLASRSILVVEGKGRKTASVPMSRSLHDALSGLPRENEYVIAGYRSTEQARRRINALCRRAGIEPRALHSLRHAAGTRMQREGKDLQRTATLLRHSSVATTQIYVHHADESVKRAVSDW